MKLTSLAATLALTSAFTLLAHSDMQRLSFDDLRSACQNPAKFHNQIAPTNIQISCNDLQYKWVSDSEGALSMPTARYITTTLTSDKYAVDTTTAGRPSDAQTAACPRFKQVAETVESVRSVSCDELVAFNGTVADFCSNSVNALRAANFEAVRSQDTGRTINLCGQTEEVATVESVPAAESAPAKAAQSQSQAQSRSQSQSQKQAQSQKHAQRQSQSQSRSK